MKTVLKFIMMTASLIVTCVLILMGFNSVKIAMDTRNAANNSNLGIQQELEHADITLLSGNEFMGDEVLNCIRKYQRIMPVTVIGSSGSVTYPNAQFIVTNTPGSTGWVNPDLLYLCSVNKNANGVIESLSFLEKDYGLANAPEIVTDINAAKQLMLQSIGGLPGNSTWNQIADAVSATNNYNAKLRLVQAVGGGLNTSMTWAEIASTATTVIAELRQERDEAVMSAEQTTAKKASGTLFAGESVVLPFEPELIAVVSERGTMIYTSGIWSGGDYCSYLDKQLINHDNLFQVNYYAYK